MTPETSLLAEGLLATFVVRLICLATLLLTLAWLLARAAGPHRAALRSHIWTTALLLLLLLPALCVLSQFNPWPVASLPAQWLPANHVIPPELPAVEPPPGQANLEAIPSNVSVPANVTAHQVAPQVPAEPASPKPAVTAAVHVEQRLEDPVNHAQIVAMSLIALWLAGVFLGLLRLAHGLYRVRKLLHSARPVDNSRLDQLAPQVCRPVGSTRLPRILNSPHVSTALAVFHRLQGTVILPKAMLDTLPDDELADVLIHECAHLRNRDPIVGILYYLAAVAYWPHPLIHLARREWIRSREEVCDNHVLATTGALEYAKTLVGIAERGLAGPPLPVASPLSGSIWRLEDRIAGLLEKKRSTQVAAGRWFGAAVALLLVSVVAAVGSVRFAGVEQEETEPVAATTSPRGMWYPDNVIVLGDERGRVWSSIAYGFDVHPGGKQIAAGGYNGVIHVWNAKTLELEHLLRGHAGSVQSLSYSPDGSSLISIGDDRRIVAWDLTVKGDPTYKTIGKVDGHPGTTAWSADATTALFAQKIWCYSNRRFVEIAGELPPYDRQKPAFSAETKALMEALQAESTITTMTEVRALSADGSQVAIASGGMMIWINGQTESATRYTDSTVTVSRIPDAEPPEPDPVEGNTDGTAPVPRPTNELQKRFELKQVGYVQAMAFSPDGATLAVGCQKMETRLFDLRGDEPQLVQTLQHEHPVKTLCFDRLGHKLAVAAGNIQVWDMTRNPPVTDRKSPLVHTNPFERLEMKFSPDGNVVYYLAGGLARRWDLSEPFQPLESPPLDSSTETRSLRFIDENRFLCVVGRGSESVIMCRDLTRLSEQPQEFACAKDRWDDLEFSPDGERFVFSAFHRPRKHRNPRYRKERYLLQLWERTAEGARHLDTADLEAGHPGSFWCAAFSPDGMTLVTGHRDGWLRLWDLRQGKLELRSTGPQVHSGGVGGMDYSPDGNTLATVDWGGGVKLWDVSGGQILRKEDLGRHEQRAYTVRFSPDGSLLASGDYGGDLTLWHLGDAPPLPTELVAHRKNVRSLAFGPDGKKLLSAGGDGRVIIWDVEKATPLHQWHFPGFIYDAQFDPTGRKIVSANGNGSTYVWEY